jgi:hypothetical protein
LRMTCSTLPTLFSVTCTFVSIGQKPRAGPAGLLLFRCAAAFTMRLNQFTVALSLFLPLLALSARAGTHGSITPLQPLAITLIRETNGSCTVVSLTDTQNHRLLSNCSDVVVETTPARPGVSSEKLQIIGYGIFNIWIRAKTICPDLATREAQGELSHIISHNQHVFSATRPTKQPQLEVHPLVVSGRSRNRVDLTFFSDGCELEAQHRCFQRPCLYTLHRIDTIDEKDKFLADAKRLALDMSQNQTFATVQPLMNFWAAFSPSREVRYVNFLTVLAVRPAQLLQSGIGVGGTPKECAMSS